MKFIPTSRHNPCPLCCDISGDCRHTENGLILCHDFIDDDPQIAGWRWKKSSQCGVWGVFAPDDGQTYDPQLFEQRRLEREKQARLYRVARAKTALGVDERDKAIRRIHKYVGLSLRHRQMLRERGLSDQQINDGLFFSIAPYQELPSHIPQNLPGVHWLGDRLATKDSGYACVVFDFQGRAIGWQIRRESDEQKYRWAKGTHSSHLPNGELPITVENPLSLLSDDIWLTEGILKPKIASIRVGAKCIGASGGNFKGSQQQVIEILDGYDTVVIAPDAGDVLNRHVMKRWQTQIEFFQSIGKLVKVAWWGQVEKTVGDIDEINKETLTTIVYLSPSEFLEIAEKQQFKKQLWGNWKNTKKFTAQVKINKRFFEYGFPQSGTMAFWKSGLGTGKTRKLIEELKKEAFEKYGATSLGYRNGLLLQFCELSSFYHLHENSVHLSDPTLRLALCVDSILRLQPEDFEGKILIIDEVVSVIKHLLFSSTIRNRRQVIERFFEAIRRSDRVVCLDGLMADWVVNFFKKICPEKQIVTVENTWKGDKAEIYLLEGTIDFQEKLRKNDKSPWLNVLLNQSAIPAVCSDSQIFIEALDNLLIEQGKQGLRIDSKTTSTKEVKEFLAAPVAYIEKHKLEYLLYTPTAESGLDVPINNYFTEHFGFFFGVLDVDSILQMIGRIRDINVPKYLWVKEFVIFSEGDTKSPIVETLIHHFNKSLNRDLNLLLGGQTRGVEIISNILTLVQESQGIDFDCAMQLQAIKNFEKANLRECVKYSLIESGYKLTASTLPYLVGNKEADRQIKEATNEVKVQNSIDIYNASNRHVGKPDIKLRFDASWKEQCEVIKANYLKRLPGIELTERWSPSFVHLIRYQQPNLINQIELFHLVQNPDVAKRLSLDKYYRLHQQFFNREKIVPWKIRQQYSQVKTLAEIGILDLLTDLSKTYTSDSLEIQQIVQKCQSKKVQQILKRKPGKDPIKFVGWLLQMIGVKWHGCQIRNSVGDRCRVYQIDSAWLVDPARLAIEECISRRYDRFMLTNCDPIEWFPSENTTKPVVADSENLSKMTENFPSKIPPSQSAETISEQSFNPVTLPPNNLYKNTRESVTETKHNTSSLDTTNYSPEIRFLVNALPLVSDWTESALAAEWEIINECYSRSDIEKALCILQDSSKKELVIRLSNIPLHNFQQTG